MTLVWVLFLAGLVAASAYCELRVRSRPSDEARALESLWSLASAQETFRASPHSSPGVQGYAHDFALLTAAGLLAPDWEIEADPRFARRGGYRFELTRPDHEGVWFCTAAPEWPGHNGDRWFGLGATQLLAQSTEGPVAFASDGSITRGNILSR